MRPYETKRREVWRCQGGRGGACVLGDEKLEVRLDEPSTDVDISTNRFNEAGRDKARGSLIMILGKEVDGAGGLMLVDRTLMTSSGSHLSQ